MPKHAHKLVYKTARDMAGALYEEVMHDNVNFTTFKALNPGLTPKQLQAKFIAAATPRLLDQARSTLAQMLAGNYPEHLKAAINDALVKDASLMRGRARAH